MNIKATILYYKKHIETVTYTNVHSFITDDKNNLLIYDEESRAVTAIIGADSWIDVWVDNGSVEHEEGIIIDSDQIDTERRPVELTGD